MYFQIFIFLVSLAKWNEGVIFRIKKTTQLGFFSLPWLKPRLSAISERYFSALLVARRQPVKGICRYWVLWFFCFCFCFCFCFNGTDDLRVLWVLRCFVLVCVFFYVFVCLVLLCCTLSVKISIRIFFLLLPRKSLFSQINVFSKALFFFYPYRDVAVLN